MKKIHKNHERLIELKKKKPLMKMCLYHSPKFSEKKMKKNCWAKFEFLSFKVEVRNFSKIFRTWKHHEGLIQLKNNSYMNVSTSFNYLSWKNKKKLLKNFWAGAIWSFGGLYPKPYPVQKFYINIYILYFFKFYNVTDVFREYGKHFVIQFP